MSIPNHREECSRKWFRTKCLDCGQRVYFLSCSCGSKVFFEECNYPWSIHKCPEYEIRYAIQLIHDSHRFTDDELIKLIETHSKKVGQIIPDKFWSIIENELGKRKSPLKIIDIEFTEKTEGFSGKVIEINTKINFYKKFHFEKGNPIHNDLMGELAKEDYDEIKIRDNPDKSNCCRQYTVYTLSRTLKKLKLQKGHVITVKVRTSKSIKPVWLIDFWQII